jgi:hypothetical protein
MRPGAGASDPGMVSPSAYPWPSSEDTGRRRVLELDEAILMILRIADRQVGLVVAENVELESDPIRPGDAGVPGADQGGEMPVTPGEGQDVIALAEGTVGVGV